MDSYDLLLEDLEPQTRIRWQELIRELGELTPAVVALSGGVDSSLLAVAAYRVMGNAMLAMTVDSPVNQAGEMGRAVKLAELFGFRHEIIPLNELDLPEFTRNPVNRCYYCKKFRFSNLIELARQRGVKIVLEGSNADDEHDYRPGKQAALELGVLSPLAKAGLTKQEIRTIARLLGIPSWSTPSTPCLATRFPYGLTVSTEEIKRVADAEAYLHKQGFMVARVRNYGVTARIEIMPDEMLKLAGIREQLLEHFAAIGYEQVLLDMRGYRQGSMNEGVI